MKLHQFKIIYIVVHSVTFLEYRLCARLSNMDKNSEQNMVGHTPLKELSWRRGDKNQKRWDYPVDGTQLK